MGWCFMSAHSLRLIHDRIYEHCAEAGFSVLLNGRSIKTRGAVLCHRMYTIDYRDLDPSWVETLPGAIIEDVLARARTLID